MQRIDHHGDVVAACRRDGSERLAERGKCPERHEFEVDGQPVLPGQIGDLRQLCRDDGEVGIVARDDEARCAEGGSRLEQRAVGTNVRRPVEGDQLDLQDAHTRLACSRQRLPELRAVGSERVVRASRHRRRQPERHGGESRPTGDGEQGRRVELEEAERRQREGGARHRPVQANISVMRTSRPSAAALPIAR